MTTKEDASRALDAPAVVAPIGERPRFPGKLIGGAFLLSLACAAFGAGFAGALSRSNRKYGLKAANVGGFALAGKALAVGSVCAFGLTGAAVFALSRLLNVDNLGDLRRIRQGNLHRNPSLLINEDHEKPINTWQDLLEIINKDNVRIS